MSDEEKKYNEVYLQQYWPEFPDSISGWADNVVLMLAYQETSIAINNYFSGRKVKMLDVSTGPALGPLLAIINAVDEVQLSDFHLINRKSLLESSVEYWRNYVPMLTKIFDSPHEQINDILKKLDNLRSQNIPIEVDLFRDSPFSSPIDLHKYELISMNFVADGITKNENDYFKCLLKVMNMVKPRCALSMSAVVDCDHWKLGTLSMPSPNISEKKIIHFLSDNGFKLLIIARSMRFPGLTYSGGWINLAAIKQ